MLVPKRLSKSKIIALLTTLIVAVAVIGYLLYTNFLADKIVSGGAQPGSDSIRLEAHLPTPPLFDPGFFNSEKIRSLENTGNLPLQVSPSQVGNPQPFAGSREQQ